MGLRFPGESNEYRKARDRLLNLEIELRRAMEAVAAARRELPPGGPVRDDYVFDGLTFPRYPKDNRPGPKSGSTARLPREEGPCPSCTAFLDQLDGAAEHVMQNLNFVVIAKAPLDRLTAFADERRTRSRTCR